MQYASIKSTTTDELPLFIFTEGDSPIFEEALRPLEAAASVRNQSSNGFRSNDMDSDNATSSVIDLDEVASSSISDPSSPLNFTSSNASQLASQIDCGRLTRSELFTWINVQYYTEGVLFSIVAAIGLVGNFISIAILLTK